MIYNLYDLMEKKKIILHELNSLQYQPETIYKRNKLVKLQQDLNGIEELLIRCEESERRKREAYEYERRNGSMPWVNSEYSNSLYSPQINPSPYSPAPSPYSSSFEHQQRPIIATNNSAAHRYARKELPEQFKNAKVINNEPPGSYVVKAEPPNPVKKYTKDSKYPILCESSLKEIELKLETGYIQREVEYKNSNATKQDNSISLFKSEKEISSSNDFYNIFKNNLSVDPKKDYYAMFSYYRSKVFMLPATDEIKYQLEKFEKARKEITEQNVLDKLFTLFNVFHRLKTYFIKRYTDMFNDLVEYSYCLNLKCDDISEDSHALKQELEKVKLVVDKSKYKLVLLKIMGDIKNLDLSLIDDNKYLRIKFKEPEAVVNDHLIYNALEEQGEVSCLRSNSYETLHKALVELFATFGDSTTSIRLVAVNETMNKLKFKVYSCSIGPDAQFIIVREK